MERKGALDRTLTPWGPFSGGEMGSLIRSHDWATTSLGPMDTWPQSIRTAIQMMLAMPQPVCLWWGEEPRLLYNDDYRTILGSKHPHALGRTMTEVWPEIVDTVEHPLNTVRAHGPQRLVDREFALGAEGERRSRWFTSTWTPIHHESGAVVGVFNVSTETTDRVLAERELRESEERQTFLLKLNDALRPVADPVKIQEVVARTLGEYLRASRVTYAEIRGDEAIIEREYTVDVPSLVGSHRLSSYGDHMRQRFECGQTDVVTDTLADPSLSPEQRTAYEAMSSRAHITATVTKEGRPVAAMVVQDRYPRQWTRDEVGLVEEAAERAWAAVERAKAEKALNAEHARLDAIITTLPIGLLFMDADRGITMANEEARRIWTAAKSLEQMHDVDFRAFWPETGEPLQIEEWPAEQAIYYGRTTFGCELEIERFDGTRGVALLSAAPIRDVDGRVVGAVVATQDITERQRAETALRRSEERFRTLAETAPALIWQNNDRGENLFINKHFLDYTGKSADEIRGEGWHTLIHPDDADAYIADYMAAVREQRPWQNRNRIRRHDGTWCWFENYAQPLFDADGRYAGHIGVSTDITASVLTEQVLRESEDRQAFLLKFSDALRAEPSPDAVADRAIRMLIEHLQLDRSYIVSYRLDEDRADLVHQVGNDSVPPLPDVFILSDYPAAFRATLDGTLVIEDEFERQGLSEVERRNSGRLGMRAMVAATLRKGANSPLWSMVAISADPRRWTREEVTLVEEVAERTWAAMERARAEKALRDSEERQSFLLTLSDRLRPLADPLEIMAAASETLGRHLHVGRCGYGETDPTGQFLMVERDWTDGRMPSAVGKHRFADFGEEIMAPLLAGYNKVIDDTLPPATKHGVTEAYHAAGELRASIGIPLIKSGRIVAALFVQQSSPRRWTPTDVALAEETAERTWAAVERARSEATLRESEERNAFLVRFADAVRGLSDPVRVAEEACRLLTQQLGTDQTYWAVIDWATREYVVEYRVVAGDTSVKPIRWPLDSRDPFAAEHLAGRSVVYDDMEGDLRIPDPTKAVMAERGMRSGIAVPVMVGGTLGAVLSTSQSTLRRWTPDEIAFVEALAERAWAEIERARAEAARRHSEARFRRAISVPAVGVLFFDLAGHMHEANEAFQRMCGYTIDELRTTTHWDQLTSPEFLEVTSRHARDLAERGETQPYEKQMIRKDGTRWWGLFAPTRLGDSGPDSECAEFVIDITETMRAQEALRVSEENFRSVANVVPDLLWYGEPDGSTTWYNERWMEYTGQTVEQAIGWGWMDAIHPDDRAASAHRYREAANAGTPLQQEHRIRHRDGHYCWFLVRAQPLLDESGRVIRMYGAATNIHEARTARDDWEARVVERTSQLAGALEEVRSSEERLHLLLQQVPAMLWATDRELHVTTLMGADIPVAEGPVEDRTVEELFAEVDASGTLTLHRQVLGGKSAEFEFHIDSHTYEAHLEPLHDAGGGTIGTIGVAYDVTDRTLRRLQEDFIAAVSHELQTPLTSIRAGLGLLDTAIGETLAPAERELLSASRRNAERLRLEIGQLLAANQLTSSPRVERSVIDLHGVVEGAVQALQSLFHEKDQTVTVDMPDRLEVDGDRRLLDQVLDNLLSNAHRHTPPGTSITVSGWFVGEDVRLAVHDTGPGIPTDQLEEIFQRFYRSPGSRREGIGLGLAITRDAVEAQGGRVWAESVLGQGTTFFVSLPGARDRHSA